MKSRTLEKKDWNNYFDLVSKSLEGKRATIEVASLQLGDQIEADRVVLYGITYDMKDDLLEIALEGLDHMIRKPVDIELIEGASGLQTIGVVDADGTQQIIRLSDPLMLGTV